MAENSSQLTVLVVGASGIIGRAHVQNLANREDRRVIAASRRPEVDLPENASAFAVDLTAPKSVDGRALSQVTHMLYCAYVDAPTWDEQRAPNVALFNGALDLVEAHCPNLGHVVLLQGTKAYGSHLGPFKTPARETDPRIPAGFFYYDQHDALVERAARLGWKWTVLRPHVVIGPAIRSPMNLVAVLGVYASLMKATEKPFSFPGPVDAFHAIYQATDAALLSNAIDWAGSADAAANEVFNVTNGDFFRWSNVWPRIAEAFGLEPGAPEPQALSETMIDAGEIWETLAARRRLLVREIETLVSWSFADYVFGTTWDVMSDTGKIRRAGFHHFIDSEQMLLDRLAELKRLNIIPS